ncbi:hypothetical protein [uncultured Rummeliibacillus sp.]|uniref:hypothetical protein n=1 Tax=uncultured Rummeliibacillus sp. TaxID=762292 RepID=UPI002638BF66|nr:hypothetical protein [uncultured Rummeliibacillus sp.]
MKCFLDYVTWVIIIVFSIYMALRFRVYLGKEAEISFDNKQIMIFNLIFPIFVGILLRLPKFLKEKKGKKKWRMDWIKLIVIALPALYFLLLPYLSYSSFGDKLVFTNQILALGDTTIMFTIIAGIVFGYVLTDSVNF